MMHNASNSLQAALAEVAKKSPSNVAGSLPYMLGWLTSLVGELMEGDKQTKETARRALKQLIGRGRCILNAADFNAGLKKGEQNEIHS